MYCPHTHGYGAIHGGPTRGHTLKDPFLQPTNNSSIGHQVPWVHFPFLLECWLTSSCACLMWALPAAEFMTVVVLSHPEDTALFRSSSTSDSYSLSVLSSSMVPKPGCVSYRCHICGRASHRHYPLYCDKLWVSVLTYIHYTKKLFWWGWTSVIDESIYHVAFGDLLFSLNCIPQDLPPCSMNPFLILLVNISLYDWLYDILSIDLLFVNIWIVSFLLSLIMMP